MKALVCLILLLAAGCTRTVYVPRPIPTYHIPQRPYLSNTEPDSQNEALLRRYAAQLEAIILAHNKYAEEKGTK